MDDFFLVITLLSIPMLLFFIVRMIFAVVKKDDNQRSQQLKFSGIALGVMIVSFFAFIATADPAEREVAEVDKEKIEVTASEDIEKEPELTEEEKAEAAEKEKLATEAKAKADAEQKAKEEADAKALEELVKKEAAEKKANAQTIDYAQLKKNPDRYEGEYVKYTGEIVQIMEDNDMTNIRLAVTMNSDGYDISEVIFIEYAGYTDFVDEDIVTIYGEVYGSYSYESQAGYNIWVPGILAEEVVTP